MAAGLPNALTSYVGRRREAAEIRSHLRTARLVTLTGPGGVGKTRLAASVAAESARGFADGVVFAGLAELRDAELVPNLVADRLGLQDRSGRSVERVVLDHLRERAVLLVLDNCEHLVEACAKFAAAVLAECPRAGVLATGRQSLGVAGEKVVRVPPLPVPGADAGDSPEELSQYDAVRLFADRATAAVPAFRVTAENSAEVARICRGLDGLPLAIELAAARLRSLSPRQLAERLTRRLPLLTAAPRTAPERQQTLRATIDWSYELCSPAERAVWARVSVFAGSFDLDAAEEVCGGAGVDRDAVLDLIDELLDKSVLIREERHDVVRYRMLETLREYGQERLEQAGDRARVARAHRDWIDRLTERADAEWASPHQLAWIDRLRNEHANLRAALDWSIAEPGEAGAALRIARRVDEYWALRGFSLEARRWLERALAAAPAEHPDRPFALATSALFALWHSDADLAATRLTEAEELSPGSGGEPLAAYLTYVRSLEAMIRLDLRTAELGAAAAAAFRVLGDLRRELHPLYIQGVALAYTGGLETARDVLRRMLALSESCGELYYRSIALAGLVHVEVQFGEVAVAAEAARDGLVITRTIGSRLQLAYRLDGMAWVASRQGEFERAATLFGAAATVWEAVGASADVAVALPHRRFLNAAREALGPERFDALFAAGRAFTDEQATRFALGEDTATASHVSGGRPLELTEREWEIARLVAEGLSNPDIAARLVISRRTAETHVQRVLTKLGFRNRAQIAAWVTARR
ncbi:ATP-binding protein [Amycolatopsis anabasis]|uniref:ATP-binding protein n=1 Tax=Amycolatopsis anabasis TaxID=1840409 RepID=UPI001FEA92ED|nr:LuxR C-terminal-related transcriptional regulator [Amycolatopsis anabasis]